ncbi:MAG: site-specific integrase [Nanoarchaeota archaeon]|nr:site-specific integrase [Nanoarchaeota archaeon]MBU4300122.1 site-specific integrase [Nanoarchaeota archaeon]MBU4451764.1 site-specific integrase [Nanoarchaeota archaeon]MCG2724328.1 site-specific integrase [archaeon]
MGFNDVKEKLYDLTADMNRTNALIERSDMSARNKQTLFSFRDWLISRQLSLLRVKKYLMFARTITQNSEKDLIDYTKADIDSVMTKIRLCGRYKPASINDFATTFKVMFRFIDGLDDGEQSPRTKHLRQKKPQSSLRREDLLTDDDVNKLISAASGLKDGLMYSTIFGVLYETGCRPGEIRGIMLRDVVKNTHGYRINVDGKTGKRVVFAIVSAPMLEKWINAHAFREMPDTPLFYYMTKGEPRFITHPAFSKTIKLLSTRVLGRAITPYLFRHSRLTQYVLKKVPEGVIRKAVGHAPQSRALSTYTHLVDEDVENEMFAMSGIDVEQKKVENTFVVKTCPKCSAAVASHESICSCGNILNGIVMAVRENENDNRFEKMEQKMAEMMQALSNVAASQQKNIMVGGMDISASGCQPLNGGEFIPNSEWRNQKDKLKFSSVQ